MRTLELLAPAKTADIGIEAIRHGADAVYIGPEAFGARRAAANSVADIKRLADFAHQFRAKVYATVNTIIYEDELRQAERLIRALYEAGVDALIVQDMAVAELDIPPIPLHASTQMDNRTPEKVEALYNLGYEQVVLARELSLQEIGEIHSRCPQVRLEAFVHGALCVSFSGRCYVSQALFGRSANRGECAQVCRMEFDLENRRGEKLVRGKHLLSLKDMCRLQALEDMAEAGVSSFKIEGRLKDMGYVKNVTAAYSQALDRLVEKFPDRYRRASVGDVSLKFCPDVEKSFNRGFTDYFLYGKDDRIFAFDSPKATGKKVGKVKEVYTDHIVVDGTETFANGDGLCTFGRDGTLTGFRVNRAEGQSLFVQGVPAAVRRGQSLYRNFDKQFEDILKSPSADRTIPVVMNLDYDRDSQLLTLEISASPSPSKETIHSPSKVGIPSKAKAASPSPAKAGSSSSARPASLSQAKTGSPSSAKPESLFPLISSSVSIPFAPELARTPQRDNILRQLSKLGGTPLRLETLNINYKENLFIPSSSLSEWRRQAVARFLQALAASGSSPASSPCSSSVPGSSSVPPCSSSVLLCSSSILPCSSSIPGDGIAANFSAKSPLPPLNVANSLARRFYGRQSPAPVPPAFELQPSHGQPLMTCRHCIRYALGWCFKRQSPLPGAPLPSEPLFLSLQNGARLALHFDCSRCLMTVNH